MNIANNQSISGALGVSYTINSPDSMNQKILEPIVVQADTVEENATTDYEFTRRNLHQIIEKGQVALDDMITFAKASQEARGYEVVGTLISNLVDANQKLIMLSKQIKDIQETGPNKDGKTVTNNLFVGSTAELQKLIKGSGS